MSRPPFLSFQCTECSLRIRQSQIGRHVACPSSRFRCSHCRATLASRDTAERHYCARFALAKHKWQLIHEEEAQEKEEEEEEKAATATTAVFASPVPIVEVEDTEEPALDAIVVPIPDAKPPIMITWPATWIASKTCPGCETMFPTTCLLATHLFAFRTHLPRGPHPVLKTCGLHAFGTRCPDAEQPVPFVFWEDA